MGNAHATEDKSSSTSIGSKGRRRSKVFGRFGKKTKDPSGAQTHGAAKGEGHSDGAESKSLDRQSESTNSFDQLQEGTLDYDFARDALSVDVESRGAECTSQERTKRPAPAAPHKTSSSAPPTADTHDIAIPTKDDHVLLTPKQDEVPLTASSARKASPNPNGAQTPHAKIAEAGSGAVAAPRIGFGSRVTSTSSKHAQPKIQTVVPRHHASTPAERSNSKPSAQPSIAATRTSAAATKTTKAAPSLLRADSSGVEPRMEVTTAESALVQRTRKENGENTGGKSTGDVDGKLVAAVDFDSESVVEAAKDASEFSPSLTAASSDSGAGSRSIDPKTNRKSFVESPPISADDIPVCRGSCETRECAVPGEIPSQQNQREPRTRLTSRSSASGAGREVFIETDSWRTVETLVAGICCSITSSDNLEIGTGDVIIIREQTASSSSDSLFTDPLTPLGFAAELNQCYVSEGENVCETGDEEALREITKAALEARNYPRKTSTYANNILYKPTPIQTLSNLSVSEISYLSLNGVQQNETPVEVIVAERKPGKRISDGSISNEEVFSSVSEDLCAVISGYKSVGAESIDEMPIHFRNKVVPVSANDAGSANGSNIDGKNGSIEPGMFNIAKAKKVELQNLSSRISEACSIAASADSTPGKTCSSNDAHPCVVISERTSPTMLTTAGSTATSSESLEKPGDDVNIDVGKGASSSAASTTSTAAASPASATMPTGTLTCSPIQSAAGDRNVLTKVASFIVERSNGDNTAKRPSHVPEKLNFAACEKFEGQMLMKWLMTSMQSAGSLLNEIDLNALAQQCCMNLLIAGVIKPICDKQLVTSVEAFNPYQMYQWSYSELPHPSPSTPGKLDPGMAWPFASTPFHGKSSMSPDKPKTIASNTQTNHSATDVPHSKIPINRLRDLKRQLLNCETVDEMCRIFEFVFKLRKSGSPVVQHDKNSRQSVSVQDLLNETEMTIYESRTDLAASPAERNVESVRSKNGTNMEGATILKQLESAVSETDKPVNRSAMLKDILNETDVTIYENTASVSELATKRKLYLDAKKEDKTIQTSFCDTKHEKYKNSLHDRQTQTEDINLIPDKSPTMDQIIQTSGSVDEAEGEKQSTENITLCNSVVYLNEKKKESQISSAAPPPPPPPPPPNFADSAPIAPSPPPPPVNPCPPPPPPPPAGPCPPPPPPPPAGPCPPPPPPAGSCPPPPPPPPAGPCPPPPPPVGPCPPPPSPMFGLNSSAPCPPPPPPPLGTDPPLPPPIPSIPGAPLPPPPIMASGPPAPPPPFGANAGPIPPPPPSLTMPDGAHQSVPSLKTPPIGGPPPLPMPQPGGAWFQSNNTLRKNAVNPPKPMKPLYWTRIVAPKPVNFEANVPAPESPKEKELWQEIDETNLDNIDEFTELFSRQAVVPKAKKEASKPVRVKTIKVLDSKRSQNVGILSRSLHVDFVEIEHAIYHCDTSVVSLEALQHIMEVKASPEELAMIKEAAQGDIPLDDPEKFLLKLSEISSSAERISCIVFQAEFDEGCVQVSRKLQIVKQLSEFLVDNEDLKLLFSIILTLGNYMNGGNRSRGQADGFGLEILGKLRDVKSKDSKITLLHFIVKTYITQRRKEGVPLHELILPVPEPGDVDRAINVDFDEVKQQINDLSKKLAICQNTTEKVIVSSDPSNVQPFKDKMEQFIEAASRKIEKQLKKLDECQEIFIKLMKFYHFIPKSGTLEQSTPGQFFEYWASFTNDFKDIWKKEIAMLSNELLKKMKQQNLNIPKTSQKVKPGSLKERLQKLGKK